LIFFNPQFDWDEGNQHKSVIKHGVSNDEAESIFFDRKKVIALSDQTHSEIRYLCTGLSNQNRILTAYITLRGGLIRIIGTRPANKKEIRFYEKG